MWVIKCFDAHRTKFILRIFDNINALVVAVKRGKRELVFIAPVIIIKDFVLMQDLLWSILGIKKSTDLCFLA